MSFMPPTDSMFLLAESREHPMHVGGLQLFVPPDGAGPEFGREMLESFRGTDNVSALFRRRPAEPVSSLGNTWWWLTGRIVLSSARGSGRARGGRGGVGS